MKIVWDEPKRRSNLEKHGLDFATLTEEWFLGAVVEPVRDGRWKAVGTYDGETIIAVIFRPLGMEAIALISMRHASRKERSRT